jgi:hypothetical protein
MCLSSTKEGSYLLILIFRKKKDKKQVNIPTVENNSGAPQP